MRQHCPPQPGKQSQPPGRVQVACPRTQQSATMHSSHKSPCQPLRHLQQRTATATTTIINNQSINQSINHRNRLQQVICQKSQKNFVKLIVFILLLVHLILHISPHHSHHLSSHHLSLPRPFTPDLKLISFTNPFLHSHSYSFRAAFTDLH